MCAWCAPSHLCCRGPALRFGHLPGKLLQLPVLLLGLPLRLLRLLLRRPAQRLHALAAAALRAALLLGSLDPVRRLHVGAAQLLLQLLQLQLHGPQLPAVLRRLAVEPCLSRGRALLGCSLEWAHTAGTCMGHRGVYMLPCGVQQVGVRVWERDRGACLEAPM